MLLPYYHKQLIEAGVDEVGRGCLAGPVVAAAVILPANAVLPTLNDSKKLTSHQRISVSENIKKQSIAWAIAEVDNLEIDKINILRASIKAMQMALDKLLVIPDHILVDGNTFSPYKFIPHTCVVKGDAKYASIAAASVLAKCYRDELMQKLSLQYPQYGWDKNVGYPTLSHRKAILTYGFTPLHRLTFGVKP